MSKVYRMGKRKMYNTTLDVELLREIKILAAQLDLRQNDIIEEAIQDLIKNYKNQNFATSASNK
jgi:hypothetical protein